MQRYTSVNETDIIKIMTDAEIQSVSIAYGREKDKITAKPIPEDNDDKAEKVYGVASLSKPVFAYLVLKLINNNDFRLDSKLNIILPFKDFCANANIKWIDSIENKECVEQYTPAMALSHQTGLPIGYNPGPDAKNPTPLTVDFNPKDKKFAYSGLHLMYLQACIEKKFGKSLEELAQEFVFTPAGMSKSTTFNSPKGQNACNSLYTTVTDYAKFCIHWMNDPDPRIQDAFNFKVSLKDDLWAVREGISPETLDRIGWGYGWGLERDDSGNMTAFHTGDMCEWRAGVQLDLNTKSVKVFFSKSDYENGHLLQDSVFGPSHALDYFFNKFKFARSVDELKDDWRKNRSWGLRKESITSSIQMSSTKNEGQSTYKSPNPFSTKFKHPDAFK